MSQPVHKAAPLEFNENVSQNGQISHLQAKVEIKHERIKDTTKKATGKNPTLKREQSDIFKSFSRPKSKTAQEGNGNSPEANLTPAAPELVRSLLPFYEFRF